MLRAFLIILALVMGLPGLDASEPFEVVVSAQDTTPAGDHVLVEVVVLDSALATLPGLIQLRFPATTVPAWCASGLPARRLLVAPEGAHFVQHEDRGPVTLAGEDEPLVAPAAPSLEDLAAKATALALADEQPVAAAPPVRWVNIQRRVRVLDSGDTLLVECLDGPLETGGAVLVGQPVTALVVACDGRFAVLSELVAAPGDELILRQDVQADDDG